MIRRFIVLVLCLAPALAFGQTYSGPGGPIGDGLSNNPGTPMSSTILVPGTGLTVVDVQVQLNDLSHTWQGDLWARLTHGSTTVDLFRRPGQGTTSAFGFSNDFVPPNALMYMDSAPTTHASSGTPTSITGPSVHFASTNPGANVTGAPTAPGPPAVVPVSLNSAFGGSPCDGSWTLTITDHAAGDTGALGTWDLKLVCVPEPAAFAVFGGALLCLSAIRRRK